MELAGADPIRWLVGRETVEVRSSDALRRAAEGPSSLRRWQRRP